MSLLFKWPEAENKGLKLPEAILKKYKIRNSFGNLKIDDETLIVTIPEDKYIIEEDINDWIIKVYTSSSEKNIMTYSCSIALSKGEKLIIQIFN
jgi:hypothetical protein